MGFLMGAYGKLMTGKLVRDIQFQMLGIQSRLRRVTRDIGDKTKMYEMQERNMKAQMQSQMQASLFGYMGIDPMYAQANMSNPYFWQDAATGMDMTQYSKYAQMAQMQFAQANTMWQNVFEMQKQADLQALKDLEDSLQLENENLKSRLEIAKQEYEAFKQEEKADAKSITPEYTPSNG